MYFDRAYLKRVSDSSDLKSKVVARTMEGCLLYTSDAADD